MTGRRFPHASLLGDLAVASALAALAMLELAWPGGFVGTGPIEGDRTVLVPTALAMTLPLVLRRRRPLLTVAVVFGAAAVQDALTTPPDGLSAVIALLVAAYSVAAYSERRRAVAGLTVAVAASVPGDNGGDLAFAAVLIGGAWGAGRLVRRQNELLDALAREQEARERAAVADERARLARELHDVIAHAVTTMVVQAEAGQAMLERKPERAHDAFGSIMSSGRQALGELRRMLGLLHEGGERGSTAPQPGLTELEALVEELRGVGLAVDLTVEGEPRPLPGGVDLSAYRIVQEALTNTLKHAANARARVTVRYQPDGVELEVVDDGRANGRAPGGGHGIAGMRERVRLYGGTFEAGRRDGGGFAVRARLPAGAA